MLMGQYKTEASFQGDPIVKQQADSYYIVLDTNDERN